MLEKLQELLKNGELVELAKNAASKDDFVAKLKEMGHEIEEKYIEPLFTAVKSGKFENLDELKASVGHLLEESGGIKETIEHAFDSLKGMLGGKE